MQPWSHRRVLAVAAIASAVALALVLVATSGRLPEGTLPVGPDWVFAAIPHVNAVIAVAALAAMAMGYRAIRARRIATHRRWMMTALGAFALFLVLYLYNVGVTGPHPFPGPDAVYTYVYLPILVVHMVLATVCVPLLIYVALLATTRPVGAIARTHHPRVGRPTLALWATSFVLGLVVYAFLYVLY